MALRVTFDTNVLDLACRPERFPKDARQPGLAKIRDALVRGELAGFYSVTMLTIEGIMKKDRAEFFGSTRTVLTESVGVTKNADLPEAIRQKVGSADLETIKVNMQVDQPAREGLHPEVIARMAAAKALGVRVLKAVPRIGAFSIRDPEKEYYLDNGEGDALNRWISHAQSVSSALESRGLGYSQVKALGRGLSKVPEEVWFRALRNAPDIHAQRAVQRAFGEWADGDAIAAHIAYGLDVFCSADVGKSNVTNSVLDPTNRQWLTSTYGVKFMTFDDLLASLS